MATNIKTVKELKAALSEHPDTTEVYLGNDEECNILFHGISVAQHDEDAIVLFGPNSSIVDLMD